MPSHTIAEIAEATGLQMVGDGSVRVEAACAPEHAGENDLAVAVSDSYAGALKASAARAAVVWADADHKELNLTAALLAGRPRVALASVTGFFQRDPGSWSGIHPSALVDPTAEIADDVGIGPFAVVQAGVSLAKGVQIGAHVTIGPDARIGTGSEIRAGARIGARCTIGARVLIHENAVIGSDGFSFEPPQAGAVEAAKSTGRVDATNAHGFLRIHSLAAVTLADDIEVGANATIDRGTLQDTRVGRGTKIDNQVQIAHNVQIGENCLICAQVGLAGSVTVGDRVVLGGKVGVGDHLKIGSDVVCAGGTLLASNVPDRSVMMGIPGIPREDAARQVMSLRRLPKVIAQVAEIRKTLGL